MNLRKRLKDLEANQGGLFILTYTDGKMASVSCEKAVQEVFTRRSGVVDIQSPEGSDNGILPDLMKAVILSGRAEI